MNSGKYSRYMRAVVVDRLAQRRKDTAMSQWPLCLFPRGILHQLGDNELAQWELGSSAQFPKYRTQWFGVNVKMLRPDNAWLTESLRMHKGSFPRRCTRKVWRLRREENVYCLTRKSQSWGRGMPSMHSKLRQWLHPANPICTSTRWGERARNTSFSAGPGSVQLWNIWHFTYQLLNLAS